MSMAQENQTQEITIKIDGKEIKGLRGESLLTVARRNGFDIPGLCHHEAVTPYGSCRLCLVEIVKKGWSQLTTACNYPLMEGLEIKTESEKISYNRKLVLELLLARSPNSKQLKDLAKKYGVEKVRYTETEFETDNCILCGLCSRVCKEVVGVDALGFSQRGGTRTIGAPFKQEPDNCIACGACVYVCPTNCVGLMEMVERRKILRWHRDLEMQTCKKCGYPFAPKFQLEYFKKLAKLPENFYDTCPTCRGM